MNSNDLVISDQLLNPMEVYHLIRKGGKLDISEATLKKVVNCRNFLEMVTAKGDTIYGINTGFGHLCDVLVEGDQLEQLQENLLLSHSCGSGDEVPDHISRTMILLKLKNICLGHSGVRKILVERLLEMYNSGAAPVVYEQGSLGASGDLAPLAHMCLPLLGQGEVNYKGQKLSGSQYLKSIGKEPLSLASKEGLALINGTQFSTAYGVHSAVRAKLLFKLANLCASMSMEAFNCQTAPLHPQIHKIRPHEGQAVTAAEITQWLEGSDLYSRAKHSVQDPYSFRCVPQVHGACFDNIKNVYQIIHTEINSVSDNPLIFPEEELILSGGNFHAQPIAFAMDQLALGLCELASISERRLYQLINGHRGLPVCLIPDAGINSGLMILQYSAASSVSLSKQLATPASVDSIISSIGQEDHVSMAANAATKTYRILSNSFTVLAMEFYAAMQALSLSPTPVKSPLLTSLLQSYRKEVPLLTKDRVIARDIDKTKIFIEAMMENWSGEFLSDESFD